MYTHSSQHVSTRKNGWVFVYAEETVMQYILRTDGRFSAPGRVFIARVG